jgi:hypothetical protein
VKYCAIIGVAAGGEASAIDSLDSDFGVKLKPACSLA